MLDSLGLIEPDVSKYVIYISIPFINHVSLPQFKDMRMEFKDMRICFCYKQ